VLDDQNAEASVTVGVVPCGYAPFDLTTPTAGVAASGVVRVGIPFDAPALRTMPQIPNGGAVSVSRVTLPFGEYIHNSEDLLLPGRMRLVEVKRSWHSGTSRYGAYGSGWTIRIPRLFFKPNGDVELYAGRSELFRKMGSEFERPPGVFAVLKRISDGHGGLFYCIYYPGGMNHVFNARGRMLFSCSRYGNTVNYSYDKYGLLTGITDDLGRSVDFAHTPEGFVSSVTDFTGRDIRYTYQNGLLATHRNPLVNGMNPIVTTYTYDEARRLIQVTDPRGQVFMENHYDS
jgi:YD repeat-containing protein